MKVFLEIIFLFEFSSFFELEILIIFDKIFDVGLGLGLVNLVGLKADI